MGVQALGMGLGALIAELGVKQEIVTGHDFRGYSASIKYAVISGLMASGCKVHDIGLAVTPMAYFAQFDLDQPLPAGLTTNGHQSSLASWIGKTPRELIRSYARKDGIDFTGTPDHVAGLMDEIMQEVGGDGFLIFNSYFDRRYVMEVCEGLVPELQRRGLTRKAYAHKHLRDNLLEF